MDKLRDVIEQHRRWNGLDLYIDRIEAFTKSDFSSALENVKSLLETIAQEICNDRGVTLTATASVNNKIKKAFTAIGYTGGDHVTQISSSLANIGQNVGELRNSIGATAHGKTLDELKARNDSVNEFTRGLLMDSTEIIACFLIRGFEAEHAQPLDEEIEDDIPDYLKKAEFNDFWDEGFGDFSMGDYTYPASEILFNVDVKAYKTEYDAYNRDKAEGVIE